MHVFVPGRICLFGEHTDWAGQYRSLNADLEKGLTLITGTDQGIYAYARRHPTDLVYCPTLDDGTRPGAVKIPARKEILLREAHKGGFFSYVAGVAYHLHSDFDVGGISIDNYRTDLPVKKGLSSSAAVCVLTARAFNKIYNLNMSTEQEMEYAYRGEITASSRCGRMDQGCAFGNRVIMMSFDGDRIDVKEIKVLDDFHLVIVDLHAHKDTRVILQELNRCYPHAENDIQRGVQYYLGPLSMQITQDAVKAMESGDRKRLGMLMDEAQRLFDRYVQPACPSQLTAPVLHDILSFPAIQPYIMGGKGVGSQGDGTAQFLAKDEEAQHRIIEIMENKLDVSCLKLTVPKNL